MEKEKNILDQILDENNNDNIITFFCHFVSHNR